MKSPYLAVAALALATAPAWSADLARAPVAYKAAPVLTYNWQGFYAGVSGGYGWTTTTDLDMKGGFIGGTVGYNAQFGNTVLGIEADGHWADISQSVGVTGIATASAQIEAYGTVRGRVGWAVDRALLYGTGGVAFADNKLTATLLGVSVEDSQMHVGWTAGAGVEFAFDQNWSAKIEYLYADFGSQDYFGGLVTSGNVQLSTVKGGINYRF